MAVTRTVYSATGVTKRFGAQLALDNVDIDIKEGSILGLVGSNGAGKSTLMRILAGATTPDQGELILDGQPLRMSSMLEAWKAGIAFVSQELNLFSTLSIAENLGLVPGRTGSLSPARMAAEAGPALERLGLNISLSAPLGSLSLADRQLVEIARALIQNPRVFILDEPTSALHASEVDRLHDVLRELKSSGTAIVYISHFIEELLDIADTVTVLRDGRRVPLPEGSGPPSLSEVVTAMLGDKPTSLSRTAGKAAKAGSAGKPLRLTNLKGPIALSIDSMEARRGEVVGVAGLAGAGIEEFFAVMFGRLPPASGEISLPSGARHRADSASAVASGVAYVPADRKRLGLALEQSITDNVSSVRGLSLGRDGFVLSGRRQAEMAKARCAETGVKMASVTQPVGSLSGGNQQKVVFSKWIEAGPSLLLLDDPMRGVDIGAKRELSAVIRKLADEDRVVILYSSDPADYIAVADRVLVFVGGEVADELSGERLTEHGIVTSMNGSVTQKAVNA
jgi:ABC-type sugar transport system ATPase subunit